jgi:hypothetical protein
MAFGARKSGFPFLSNPSGVDDDQRIFAALHFHYGKALFPCGASIVGLPTIAHSALQNL